MHGNLIEIQTSSFKAMQLKVSEWSSLTAFLGQNTLESIIKILTNFIYYSYQCLNNVLNDE